MLLFFLLQIPALTQSLARIVNALPCSLKLIINNVSSSVFVIVVINSHSKPLGSRFDNNDQLYRLCKMSIACNNNLHCTLYTCLMFGKHLYLDTKGIKVKDSLERTDKNN